MISIVCLKWGDKYGPQYVNRLYSQCRKFIGTDFTFYCATDKSDGISPFVQLLDISDYQIPDGKWGGKVFTAEKLKLISDKRFFGTKVVLMDLDILILNDLTDYLTTVEPTKPLWIFNHWQDLQRTRRDYGQITCAINASFVVTYPENAITLHDSVFNENYDYFAMKFKSLDKTLYYRCMDLIDFHEDPFLVYAYNRGVKFPEDMVEYEYRPEFKLCLFNNSHGSGMDLHETTDWAKEYWESFDEC